jgi:phosphopantothenate-cysteine ligase/phosphopantothenoylcysteine decarboxylase/phosphopantothenate--cysteine ligase
MGRLLVTAGNAHVPIDAVRCISNIFTGMTGLQIAEEAIRRGHSVTLLTSHPDLADSRRSHLDASAHQRWQLRPFRTFDDLHRLLEVEVTHGGYEAVILSAAVSDYRVAEVRAASSATGSSPPPNSPNSEVLPPEVGKIKSNFPELWLRLVPTPKLVDFVRTTWNFRGVLVKFKLEVGVTEEELRQIALASCRHSQADLIVANTLETRHLEAFMGKPEGTWRRLSRSTLAAELIHEIEPLMGRVTGGSEQFI